MPLEQDHLVPQITVGALSLTPLGGSRSGERQWGWWATGVRVGGAGTPAPVCGTCYKGMALENVPSERNQTQKAALWPPMHLGTQL